MHRDSLTCSGRRRLPVIAAPGQLTFGGLSEWAAAIEGWRYYKGDTHENYPKQR